MGKLVPEFPLLGEPGNWNVLTLVAATVLLESEGEPFEGQLGVAWTIRRRSIDWKLGWHKAILGSDGVAYGDGHDFEIYSCWNSDYKSRAQARLSAAADAASELAWRAAAAALWELLPDPIQGATHYLNIPVTKKIRGGTLPSWYSEHKVTATIGRHTFLIG